ncbi:hypothetical protein [uncultured Litoreibacter sp.]|uniref:hypothetical protein n=1 Tax=uncultured Litoreibacter sp. TaxID=1392394 RepID=UPI0026398AD5|nr:hypothetical protein [uncultured Litoreibacter sp.]
MLTHALSRLALIATLALTAAPVMAQDGGNKSTPQSENIMSAETFESFVKGTTLYFNRGGQPYGAEQYKSDRRVIWTFLDGRCERGAWYNDGATICFVYETQSEAQCWNFLESGGQKRARVIGADPADDLFVVGQDKRDLSCPGPGVGVSYSPAD